MRSVTKQGDVYDPAGTVEGGSAPKTGDILGRLAELRRRTEELDKRKANWNKVQARTNYKTCMRSTSCFGIGAADCRMKPYGTE